jgi:hypothetical protein
MVFLSCAHGLSSAFPTADLHPSLLALYTEMAAPPPDSSLDQVCFLCASYFATPCYVLSGFSVYSNSMLGRRPRGQVWRFRCGDLLRIQLPWGVAGCRTRQMGRRAAGDLLCFGKPQFFPKFSSPRRLVLMLHLLL